MEFNGSRKDALKIIADNFGGDHTAFNAKYTKITIGGRAVKGFRNQGEGRPLKINYSDVVDKYEGARKEYIELSTPDPEVRKAGAEVFKANKGKGTDIDHGNRVERTGKALKPMSPERRNTYHNNMAEAGVFIGDDPRNLAAEDPVFNRGADKKQHTDLDKGIKKLSTQEAPTLSQIDATGTTSKVGRQQRAMGISRELPGFPRTRNPFDYRMAGLGGAAGLMLDADAAKKFAEGDYIGALQTGAGSAAFGEMTSRAVQWAAPQLGKLFAGATPYVAPVAKVANPIGQAVVGTQVANELVKAGTGEGFVKKVQNVQDKQRTATINAQQQQTTQQLAIKRKQTGQDQSFADNVTNVIAKGANHLQYAMKNPLSIFGIK